MGEKLSIRYHFFRATAYTESNQKGIKSRRIGLNFTVINSDICTGSINLLSQADVNAFSPDCTEWNGGISISGDDIVDLSPLQNLNSIGALSISSNPQLQDLTGLDNVTQVEHLFIGSNDNLTNIQALHSLKTITNDVFINNMPKLANLNGLESVESSIQSLRISNCSTITDLSGLGKNSGISIKRIQLDNLASLESLGLEHISGITNLLIFDNAALRSLGVLNLARFIGPIPQGGVLIRNNSKLKSLKGLESANNIMFVRVENNDSLTNLEGLEGFSIAGELSIVGNISLVSLKGLENLRNLPVAQPMDGFIIGGLGLVRNAALVDISALSGIEQIANHLNIFSNPLLSDCCILAELRPKGSRPVFCKVQCSWMFS